MTQDINWLKKAIQDAIDQAYEQGKRDGWKEGYKQSMTDRAEIEKEINDAQK